MEKLFVPYKLALLAKEKGFDEECITRWGETSKKLYDLIFKPFSNESIEREDFTAAPIYQQIIDWFAEKHGIYILINITWSSFEMPPCHWAIISSKSFDQKRFDSWYKTSYEALNVALTEAFKLI